MRGTLDEAGAGIEETVGLPLQGNATVRAAIAIEEHLAAATGRQNFQAIDVKPAALCLAKVGGLAEQVHFRFSRQSRLQA
ncbi:hypothetical protein D3C80_1483630 [compost metagenome]